MVHQQLLGFVVGDDHVVLIDTMRHRAPHPSAARRGRGRDRAPVRVVVTPTTTATTPWELLCTAATIVGLVAAGTRSSAWAS